MNKQAIAANKLLKALKIGGVTAAGGVAIAGTGVAGYRTGAKRTADKMTTAFIDANNKENKQIVDSFKKFNKIENRQIANAYLRKGLLFGSQYKVSQGMKKAAAFVNPSYSESFEDELKKLGYAKVISKGIKTLGKSFKNLKSGAKGIKDAATMKGLPGGRKANLRAVASQIKDTAKSSKAAIATTGSAAIGTGYALS